MAFTVVEITSLGRIKEALLRSGLDPHQVVLDSTLPASWLDRTEGFLPLSELLSFYVAASRALKDPNLGLTIAEMFEPSDYGMIGHLFKVQPTFNDALDALQVYYNQFLADDLSVQLTRRPEHTTLTFCAHVEHPGSQLLSQELVAICYLAIARYAAEPIAPLHVSLRQVPQDPERYHALFGVEVEFGAQEDGITLPSLPLALPCPSADPRLARILLEHAEAHLERRREAAGTAGRLLRLEGCVVDLRRGQVHRDGEILALTTREKDLLEYFSSRPNQTVSHEDLEQHVWRLGRSVVSHAPAVAIRRLRQKIEPKPRRPVNLITVFGEGWKLSMTEEAAASLPPPPPADGP